MKLLFITLLLLIQTSIAEPMDYYPTGSMNYVGHKGAAGFQCKELPFEKMWRQSWKD